MIQLYGIRYTVWKRKEKRMKKRRIMKRRKNKGVKKE